MVVEVVVEEVVVRGVFEPTETAVGLESSSCPVDGEFPMAHGAKRFVAPEVGGWVDVQEIPVQGADVVVVVVDAPCAAGRETAASKSQIAAAL
jgi:hypothetical protein